MMASLDEAIVDVREALEFFESKGKSPIEEATRDTLINPILIALGWPVRKPHLVETQYEVLTSGDDRAVDYALKDDGDDNPVVFVEAKRLSNRLGAKEERQLSNYVWTYVGGLGLKRGAKFGPAVLTNGRVWKFYPIDASEGAGHFAGWNYSIDLLGDDIGKCRDALEQYLSHDGVLDGSANKALGSTAMTGQVRGVWEKLLTNPPDDFIEFVRGKLGSDIPADVIKQAITGKAASVPPIASKPAVSKARAVPSVRREESPWTKLRVHYRGQVVAETSRYKTIFKVLQLLFADFGRDKFIEVYGKLGHDILDPAESARKNNEHEWMLVAEDMSIFVGWLNERVEGRFNRLAEAFGIAGQIKREFVLMDDPRGSLKVRVDDNEYDSTAPKMSGVGVLMEALDDVVEMPEARGVDFAEVCARHRIIRRKRTWIIREAELREVDARRQEDYKTIGSTGYMVQVNSNTDTKGRNLRKLVNALGVGERVEIWFRGQPIR